MSLTNDDVKKLNKMCPISKDVGLAAELVALRTAIEVLDPTAGDGVLEAIDDLETAVGDAESGLVKNVADLETTIGDASAGLVKDVDDLQAVVGGPASGLVKYVSDLQTAVGDESSGLVEDMNRVLAAPTAETATLDGTKTVITIPMSLVVYNGSGVLPIDIKSGFTISTDGETYNALGASDQLAIGGRTVQITLDAALSTATNTIKIAAGTLISAFNVANEEIITNNLDATGA